MTDRNPTKRGVTLYRERDGSLSVDLTSSGKAGTYKLCRPHEALKAERDWIKNGGGKAVER